METDRDEGTGGGGRVGVGVEGKPAEKRVRKARQSQEATDC